MEPRERAPPLASHHAAPVCNPAHPRAPAGRVRAHARHSRPAPPHGRSGRAVPPHVTGAHARAQPWHASLRMHALARVTSAAATFSACVRRRGAPACSHTRPPHVLQVTFSTRCQALESYKHQMVNGVAGIEVSGCALAGAHLHAWQVLVGAPHSSTAARCPRHPRSPPAARRSPPRSCAWGRTRWAMRTARTCASRVTPRTRVTGRHW